MQTLFTNRFEKKEGSEISSAQVSIVEKGGDLGVHWHMFLEGNEEESHHEQWYAGPSWSEMLAHYKYGITAKMAEGFAPIIPALPAANRGETRSHALQVQRIHFYCEQHRNEPLYEALRKWRRSCAKEARKIPYMIANNRLLSILSALVPHNEDELLQIPGIGEQKLKMYGQDILKVTKQYAQPAPFPLNWLEDKIDEEQFRSWLMQQQAQKYKTEMEGLQNKKKMLQGIADGKVLEELQEHLALTKREFYLLLEQIDKEGYDLTSILEQAIQALIPNEELQLILESFEALGDQYLKPVFETVYADEAFGEMDQDERYERLRLSRIFYRQTHTHHLEQAASS